MLVPEMKRFLQDLEACLKTLDPAGRARMGEAFTTLAKAIRAGTAGMKGFKPSLAGTSGVLLDLLGALRSHEDLVAKAKKLAPSVGPNVTAILQTL